MNHEDNSSKSSKGEEKTRVYKQEIIIKINIINDNNVSIILKASDSAGIFITNYIY